MTTTPNTSRIATGPNTLLSALRLVRTEKFSGMKKESFEDHVVFLILELVGTALLIPGIAFAETIARWADAPDGRDFRLDALGPERTGAGNPPERSWVPPWERFAPREFDGAGRRHSRAGAAAQWARRNGEKTAPRARGADGSAKVVQRRAEERLRPGERRPISPDPGESRTGTVG